MAEERELGLLEINFFNFVISQCETYLALESPADAEFTHLFELLDCIKLFDGVRNEFMKEFLFNGNDLISLSRVSELTIGRFYRESLVTFLKNRLAATVEEIEQSAKGVNSDYGTVDFEANIRDLRFSIQVKSALLVDKIETVRDLVKKPEADLLSIRNLGDKSVAEIKKVLTEIHPQLHLGMTEEEIEALERP